MNKSILEIDELTKKVISQTTYDSETAKQKLQEFNYDYIKVIKDFMGIKDKKDDKVKNVNQEIYKQIRNKLNESTRAYLEKNPINVEHVIQNLEEEEQKKLNKHS